MKLTLLLLLTLLASCNPQNNSGVSIESKIIGGSPVNMSGWPNVVRLDLGYMSGSCTGTVISKRVILTAGHCVKGNLASQFKIKVKDPKNLFKSKTYRVEHARYHALYNNNTSMQNFDVAYLYLKEDFIINENNVIPLITREELQEISTGDQLTMVGYGKTDNGSSGKKMVVNIPLTAVTNNEVLAGTSTNNTCQGDSGGPAFATLPNGEMRQIGVTSRGEKGCRGRGIYELTSYVNEWIQSDIAFLEGQKLYKSAQYEQALTKFEESIQLFPLYPSAYSYAAACSTKLENQDEYNSYSNAATEVAQYLEDRLTNYYLMLFNFGEIGPNSYINYGCSVELNSSPFEGQKKFFHLNFNCGETTQVKVSFNNLYQDIKNRNVDYIYVYESIRHRMTVHLPNDVAASNEKVILKLFKCSTIESCPQSFSAELTFSGYSKQFSLFDTQGSDRDQINMRWQYEL